MAKDPTPMGNIPTADARACLINGYHVFKDDVASLVVLGFAMVVIGALSPLFLFGDSSVRVGGVLFYAFIGFPLEVGFAFIALRAVRSGGVRLEHLFSISQNYVEIVLAGILLSLLIIGAASFFLIPGIWVYLRTRFVPYLLIEDELDAASAIRESFKLTRGHTETILLLCIVGGATFLVGGLLALLGTSPALVWWHLSMASLYHATVTPPTGWQVEDAEELEHQKNLPEE
jgi:hypothetical protein